MARILLVDDEDPIRMFLKRALEIDGHTVATAYDGADALDRIAETGSPDLMLSDIRMPMLDGIALARTAKERHPAMLILLMTGYADQRERADDLAGIVVDVLSKPFTVAELRALVGRTLGSLKAAA